MNYSEHAVLYRAVEERCVRTRGGGICVGTGVTQSLVAARLLATLDGVKFTPTPEGAAFIAEHGAPEPPAPPLAYATAPLPPQANEQHILLDCRMRGLCCICYGTGTFRSDGGDCWCCGGTGDAPRADWYTRMLAARLEGAE